MFNHGNVRLPGSMDRIPRWVVVTPEMHRVYHSSRRRETDSNVGFNRPGGTTCLAPTVPSPRPGTRGSRQATE